MSTTTPIIDENEELEVEMEEDVKLLFKKTFKKCTDNFKLREEDGEYSEQVKIYYEVFQKAPELLILMKAVECCLHTQTAEQVLAAMDNSTGDELVSKVAQIIRDNNPTNLDCIKDMFDKDPENKERLEQNLPPRIMILELAKEVLSFIKEKDKTE